MDHGPVSLETTKLRAMWNVVSRNLFLKLCTWPVNQGHFYVRVTYIFQARVKCFILTLTSSSKVSDFRELGFSESRTVDAQRKGFLITLHSSRMSLKKTYTFLFEVGSVCVCQSSLMNGWADFCLECFLLSQSPVACSVTWRMCMSSSL